jgi:hypothetical protein
MGQPIQHLTATVKSIESLVGTKILWGYNASTFFFEIYKGGLKGGGGGGAPGARPPKIGKHISLEIPQKCSRLPPLGTIFLSAPPNFLDPPLYSGREQVQ